MQRQFTSTCYIVKDDKFLLIYHKKFQKWLPPGGHAEENELPTETSRREVKEETGLDIEFLRQENLWIDDWNATSFERPFLCLLENIEASKKGPAHQHIDFVYVARPIGGTQIDGKWFTLEEIEAFETHKEIFADTQKAARAITQGLLAEKLVPKMH